MLSASLQELISGISKVSLLFPDIPLVGVIKDDPDDDKIIACAKASGSEYIVTGDPHLIKVKQYEKISIVTPKKFLSDLKTST